MLNLHRVLIVIACSLVFLLVIDSPDYAYCSSIYQRDLPSDFYEDATPTSLYLASRSEFEDKGVTSIDIPLYPYRISTTEVEQDPSDYVEQVKMSRTKKGKITTATAPTTIPKITQEDKEFEHKINIERFKMSFLKRLHMTEPPNIPAEEANKMQQKLPLTLQRRLIEKMEADDGEVDPPPERTEEKETLILLKLLPWKLPRVSSATFAIEVADEIESSRVSSAVLQFETTESSVKGKRLEVWEIFPTSTKTKCTKDVLEEMHKPNWNRHHNLTRLFEQDGMAPSITAPSILRTISGSLDNSDLLANLPELETFQVRQGILAEKLVPNQPGVVEISMDISGTFVQWIVHKSRQTSMQKVVRTLLVVCPECGDDVEPIELKQGILEIRHRNGIRRRRRSAHGSNAQPLTITNQCNEKGHKFSCCTQPFSLMFSDVGWDNWIIHPKHVEPNYCHGSCQAEGLQKTAHSEVMHMLRNQNYSQLSSVQRDAMLSCCHPVKMASLSVLYYDTQKELKMNTLHNIIVLGCNCS